MKGKVTKRFVETIQPAERDLFAWDTEVSGFGVKITPKGRRIYVLQTRINGRLRRITIGRHGDITAEAARRLARQSLGEISAGIDPAARRDDARQAPTVADLADRYMTEHAELHKKPRSVEEDRRMLKGSVLPALGSKRITEVTREDVAKLHHRMRETPYAANRTLALISKMFNLAERWGLRPDGTNPCRHVDKYKEKKRERYLSELELARLGRVLSEVEQAGDETKYVVAAIRLLLFLGARMTEILTLRWEYIDYERNCIRLPDSKTGAKVIPLNAQALEVLDNIPHQDGSPWIICGSKDGHHFVNLEKPWRRIRSRAGLEDVRLHDLRHSFAAMAATANLSLPLIGGLLGHREASTTKKYAHLADHPLQNASEQTGRRIADAMNSDPKLRRVK